MEFHISRQSRDRYQFDQSLFSLRGTVIFANFHAARLFAQKMNEHRDLMRFPEQAVRAGHLNAAGILDEIFHLVILHYREQRNPQVWQRAVAWLDEELGADALNETLLLFADEFPSLAVYNRERTPTEDLNGETDGIPNRQIILEEMLLLWVHNLNPALLPMQELLDDSRLARETAYPQVMASLRGFFDTQPGFGPQNQNLVDLLRAPALANPYSLSAQLEYIRENWSEFVGKLIYRLLSSLDLLKEEEKVSFAGPGPTPIPQYRRRAAGELGLEEEPEAFSPDQDWMPRLVLIAKNTYVWLDQLTRQYERPIQHLDQIPDEELDLMASRGITGLWLIGLWERSAASERIKKLCGNPEAVASAYSLASYDIARDLGGESALENLRGRAWQRGIRLASDMVPNHMGIDSRWVIEHPDWFLSLPYSPFPSYTFNGPDLSSDPNVGIYLEDHYYSRTDAAVVFKRVDYRSGDVRYIYHGNDGTSMPWNDTAQLNYLNPEVREAVIQTILGVARRFPIIRFDAAMTLAKKHVQRLWFPEPGTGGAIPSRSDFSLTHDQFDAAMPAEFWREVVDRCAQEAPDTLLLAEAFWLMEGYFVRTLGMHRVYNSAFMNLLRNEENENYHRVMKNTLEFEPEILKRYVNFMNNPDERTAVDQFGKGDKYFGICTLMATLPGLPMFGHGQFEGFSEKYGMEFRHAYWDEKPDPDLIERHNREIFPLLHRRASFAGVDQFQLYDFVQKDGSVNDNVYAYSNRLGRDRSLIVYHNQFASASGTIRMSVPTPVKSGDNRSMVQRSLVEALNLHPADDRYVIFREFRTGLEFIFHSRELADRGLSLSLDAYQCLVYLDIREVQDTPDHPYGQLNAYLNGRGVASMEEALKELFLQPIHYPFQALVNPQRMRQLIDCHTTDLHTPTTLHLLDAVEEDLAQLYREVKRMAGGSENERTLAKQTRKELENILQLCQFDKRFPMPNSRRYRAAIKSLNTALSGKDIAWFTLICVSFVNSLGKVKDPSGYKDLSRSWLDEWMLGRQISRAAVEMGFSEADAENSVAVIKLLTRQHGWFAGNEDATAAQVLQIWLNDLEIQQYLGINRFQGILWFNRERYQSLLRWMLVLAVIDSASDPLKTPDQVVETVLACDVLLRKLSKAEKASGYQVEKLLTAAARR
jgi:glycosidase